MQYAEKNVAITGIGLSKISRGPQTKTPLSLTLDACIQAIEDAGLKRSDIDGLACWPGDQGNSTGLGPTGIPQVQDALRLHVDWYSNCSETAGQFGAIFNAIGAIAAGYCKHVLIWRTVYQATARKTGLANASFQPGEKNNSQFKWFAPYHAYVAAVQQSLYFARYVHESGIKEEQWAQIAINQRRNASLNPAAIYRDIITLDDYMNAPIIATPLRIYDCDLPCDGAAAIVLSRMDVAKDMPNPVLRIEAVGTSMRYRNNWVQLDNDALATQAQPLVAEMMWNRTDLKPGDVDVAELYDGFSFHTINWLENFGFCKKYEAGDFIADGKNIALEGQIPINTHGGSLSAGRMHAYGQVHEACTQLWGRGGGRQVPNDPRVAALSTSGGPLAGCFLLARQ